MNRTAAAGYLIETIKSLFTKKQIDEKLAYLWANLSYFDIYTQESFVYKNPDPASAVIYNMITRGLPVSLSVFGEEFFSNTFQATEKQIDTQGTIEWKFTNNQVSDTIFRALHIISPDKNDSQFVFKATARDLFNKDIIEKIFINKLGKHFLQSIQQNVNYKELAELDFEFLQNTNSTLLSEFSEKTIDFLINFPYPYNGFKGIIVESNPEAGESGTDYIALNKKKLLAESLKYDFVYIKKGKIEDAAKQFQKYTYIEPFEILKKNFQTPLYQRETGRDAMQMALSPFGMARIQATLLKLILSKKLDLNAEKWSIAVIERDIPAAFAAIEDLKKYYENLYTLREGEYKFPKINLTLYTSSDFAESKLNKTFKGKIYTISDFHSTKEFDVLLDFSMLSRFFNDDEKIPNAAKNYLAIRSSSSANTQHSFVFSSPIKYQTLETNSKAQIAAEYFLQSIFRKEHFFEEQISALNLILNCKSTIIITPPNTGKSMMWQFSAMLQAGLTIAVQSTQSLMYEQFIKLKKHLPDSCFYLNNSKLKINRKQEVIRRISNKQALILLATPEIFAESSFRSFISELKNKSTVFAGLVLDEAHCLSEWSHDFRVLYANLATNFYQQIQGVEKTEIPVYAFSSGASYDVRKDIGEKFKIEADFVYISDKIKLNHHLKIQIANEGPRTRDIDLALKISLQNKLKELSELLKTLTASQDKTIIFTNNSSDFAKVFEICKSQQPNTLPAQYSSCRQNEMNPISGVDFDRMQQNYLDFNLGNKQILICDESTSIGLDFEAVRNIVFFNLPYSIENFIQISGRAGRGTSDAYIYLIFDKTALSFNENIEIQKSQGETETIEQASDTIPDAVVTRKKIKQKYPGQKKELILFDELMTQINNPVFSPNQLIVNKINETFGEKISLISQPTHNPYQIAILKKDKTFGHIDFKTDTINFEHSVFDKHLSYLILNTVKSEILNLLPEKDSIFNKLDKPINNIDNEGIEIKLEQIQIGETASIEFYLNNKIADELLEILTKNISEEFKKENLIFELENNTHHVRFIENLNKTANTNRVTKQIDVPLTIESMFYRYRNENQTLTLLHRLILLKIIDNFEIDNTKHSVKIYFQKKDDETYKISLFQFLENFVAKEKAMSFFDFFDTLSGKNTIRKCFNFLIYFTYDTILEKRINCADEMVDFYKALAQNKSARKTLDFKVTSYFEQVNSAKFLNTLVIPSLKIGTFNLKISSFETVMKYINLAKNSNDTREHIKESTEFLLKQNEKNYTILLLNAYTHLWSDFKNQNIFELAYDRLSEGFLLMETSERLDYSELNARKTQYLKELYQRNSEIQEIVEPVIYIKTHANWLKNFNKSFLEGFCA